jgi:hypothetical protein
VDRDSVSLYALAIDFGMGQSSFIIIPILLAAPLNPTSESSCLPSLRSSLSQSVQRGPDPFRHPSVLHACLKVLRNSSRRIRFRKRILT